MPDITGYKAGSIDAEVVLVGILFKDLKCRPSLLDQYRDGKGVATSAQPDAAEPQHLCSDEDVLWLEDHVMRLRLVASRHDLGRLATGLVVAVRGAATPDGRFRASSFCLARMPPAPPLPPPACGTLGPFLALVSGLTGSWPAVTGRLREARERAVEFLLGGGRDELEASLGRAVTHVVLCGGVVGRASGTGPAAARLCQEALDEADEHLARLASRLPVLVMPGATDPTSASLPQLPLHPQLFRRARECPGFRSVGNPHRGEVGGLLVAGHAGQPVDDLLRCTRLRSPAEALATCLEALHLAPGAPDTLPAHPFGDEDPFVLDAVPHVLFSGGHPEPEHEWRASARGGPGTLCVCVPAFHVRPAVVLVNLHDPRDVRVKDFGEAAEDAVMEGVERDHVGEDAMDATQALA